MLTGRIGLELAKKKQGDYEVDLPHLHTAQKEVIRHPARHKVLAAGRRFGKSFLGVGQAMIVAARGGHAWWVAPSFPLTQEAWDLMKHWARQMPGVAIREAERRILFPSGDKHGRPGQVQAKSADNPDCYDDQTEILTDGGWKRFADLDQTELVFTLNSATNIAEWQRPTQYIDEYYCGPMYKLKSKHLDLLVTPNHRFLVEKRSGRRLFKTIPELVYNERIPVRIGFEGRDNSDITKLDCAIMGFYLAEGSAYGCAGGDITKLHGAYRVFFAQTDGKKGGYKGNVRQQFIELLRQAGYNPYTGQSDGIIVNDKDLWSKLVGLGTKYTKRIPKEYRELPPKKLRVLLHWLILGNGTWRQGERVYYTVSKQLADDVQEIAIKAGWEGILSVKAGAGHEATLADGRVIRATTPLYQVRICQNKHNYFRKTGHSYIAESAYKGRVYCVAVPNQVILVRRNGTLCWSGNSLVSVGLDLVVLDEAARIKEEAWTMSLRPTLADRQGSALFISTPKGRSRWFYRLWKEAHEKDNWAAFQFPTSANPLISLEEIEEARQEMPALLFRQEFLAEFVEATGYMFLRTWFKNVILEPPKGRYVRYWDLAASPEGNDYSVGTKAGLIDNKLIIADVVRGRWDWPNLRRVITDTALEDSPEVHVGVEQPALELHAVQDLQSLPELASIVLKGIPVRPTSASVRALYENLPRNKRAKAARAASWLVRAEAGNVVLVEGLWNKAWLDEVADFPMGGVPDDQVDSVSGAVQMIGRPRKISFGWA